MGKLIDADVLKTWFYEDISYSGAYVCGLIEEQPEAVVRCKDCLMHGVCRFEQGLGLDGFCSQAERRTDEEVEH